QGQFHQPARNHFVEPAGAGVIRDADHQRMAAQEVREPELASWADFQRPTVLARWQRPHNRGWSERMVPAAIRRQLGRLWARERMLDLAWGAARLVTLVTLLLFGCGLIDWFIDREQDTPEALRRLLSYLQIGAAGMAIYWFLLRPWR